MIEKGGTITGYGQCQRVKTMTDVRQWQCSGSGRLYTIQPSVEYWHFLSHWIVWSSSRWNPW